MTPDKEALAAHIDILCKRHGIGVQYRRGRAFCWDAKDERRIRVPPVRGESSYAVALHEIGHILGPWQKRKSELLQEAGAWRWAEKNALKWTAKMKATMRWSLGSYLEHARMKGGDLPPAGHELWRLLG